MRWLVPEGGGIIEGGMRSGMTIVVEILSLMLKRLSRLPRLAALARNDKVAMFRMIVEVLAWGAVVAAG